MIRSDVIATPVPEFDWRHAERALVAVGQPTIGVGVVIPNRMLITMARTALKAATGDDPSRLTIPVMASEDHRWRGAQVGILNCDVISDLALLGAAPGIDDDGLDGLDDLLREREMVEVAELVVGDAMTLHIPTVSGVWVRLPGVVTSASDITFAAQPVDEDAANVVAEWAGLPAFSEDGRLDGFVTHNTMKQLVVRRVDQLVHGSARTTADRLEKTHGGLKVPKPARRTARSSHLCTGMSTAETVAHDFMTIAEGAAEARVSPKRMRALIAAGVLREGEHYTRPAGLRPRIIREGLLQWLRGHVPSAPVQSSRRPPGRCKLNPALVRPARKPSRE